MSRKKKQKKDKKEKYDIEDRIRELLFGMEKIVEKNKKELNSLSYTHALGDVIYFIEVYSNGNVFLQGDNFGARFESKKRKEEVAFSIKGILNEMEATLENEEDIEHLEDYSGKFYLMRRNPSDPDTLIFYTVDLQDYYVEIMVAVLKRGSKVIENVKKQLRIVPKNPSEFLYEYKIYPRKRKESESIGYIS